MEIQGFGRKAAIFTFIQFIYKAGVLKYGVRFWLTLFHNPFIHQFSIQINKKAKLHYLTQLILKL